jgi:hypothetical protein
MDLVSEGWVPWKTYGSEDWLCVDVAWVVSTWLLLCERSEWEGVAWLWCMSFTRLFFMKFIRGNEMFLGAGSSLV